MGVGQRWSCKHRRAGCPCQYCCTGIYEYLLTGEEKKLSIRAFDRRDALAAYEKQGHKCPICGETFEFEQMHADHITPWSKGGKTTPENCQMLCRDCNLKKGAQE